MMFFSLFTYCLLTVSLHVGNSVTEICVILFWTAHFWLMQINSVEAPYHMEADDSGHVGRR